MLLIVALTSCQPLDGKACTLVGSLAATWEDLGPSFEPGTVHVGAELRDEAGRLVAKREQDVELSRVHPNGKDCDGDGFVNGSRALSIDDAVPAAS